MESHAFDRITRRVTTGTSRRSVVGGVLGGLAALVTGPAVLEAKQGGNGKGKALGRTKVWLCHKPDPTTGVGTIVQVAARARKGHLKHDDVECPPNTTSAPPYTKGGPCTVNPVAVSCQSV